MPSALGYHAILRLRDDRVIAPTAADKRQVARVVLRVGGRAVAGFSCVDTHLHLALLAGRAVAAQIVRRIEISLSRRLHRGVGFVPAKYVPLLDQHHLERTFWYLLRQRRHHGLDDDPFYEGCHLPDLLGLRLLSSDLCETVRTRLPRVRAAELAALLGADSLVQPAQVPGPLLPIAAAAAVGAAALAGSGGVVSAARRAAVHAVGRQWSAALLAEALAAGVSTIERYRAQPRHEPLVRAVRLQARLRAAGRDEASAVGDGAAQRSSLLL